MTLTDPTGGVGYAYGAKLPSTHMNTVTSQLPYAIDGNAGGVYNPSADIQIGTNTVKLLGTNRLEYASRRVVRRHNFIVLRQDEIDAGGGAWTMNVTGANQVNAGTNIYFLLEDLPHGAVLDEVEVGWDASGVHAADPVGCTMPILDVYRSTGPGANVLLKTKTDTTTTRALYEAEHAILASSIAHTIDRTAYVYFIDFTGEAAPDYLANGDITYIITRCNVTVQPEY